MVKHYLVREDKDGFLATSTLLLENPAEIRIVDHPLRISLLRLISKRPMYPAEIAKELKLHEQKVYYHLKQLHNAGLVEVVEKKEIRGTTAKRYAPKELSFSVTLKEGWESFSGLAKGINKDLERFLKPFVKDGKLDAKFVVGSPDPHGPHKASARDGHYAVDLALFIGHHYEMPKEFAVALDVDVHLMNADMNLIVVGGPVTNMVGNEVNPLLPVRFSDEPPWGIISERTGKTYTADNTGLIARVPNPHNKDRSILYLAGIRGVGTKSAVLALSRHFKELLQTFGEQKSWGAVVQGFDLDGDGKIDSIEIVE